MICKVANALTISIFFRLTNIIPASILEPPLKGIQILFIICAIMFLTLLLIGLGVSYYCLRRQPMPIVRRVVHVGSGSEITALETGSIGIFLFYHKKECSGQVLEHSSNVACTKKLKMHHLTIFLILLSRLRI